MISDMSIQIDGVEYLTTAEAVELAEVMGRPVSNQGVTRAARMERIEGAVKIGKQTSVWLFPRDNFVAWLKSRKPRGPKRG